MFIGKERENNKYNVNVLEELNTKIFIRETRDLNNFISFSYFGIEVGIQKNIR